MFSIITESLNLDENDFQGQVPSELGELTDLEFLSMQTNGFEGALPAEISLMTNLRTFEACHFITKRYLVVSVL